MKITIYGDSLNKGYVKSFYYLESIGKIDRLRYFGTKPLYYTLSKLKNFRNYTFKDIICSYIAPFILLFSDDIFIVSPPPYSYKVLFLLFLVKLKKRVIFMHSWPHWENLNIGIVKPNHLRLRIWENFLSRVLCMTYTNYSLKALKNKSYRCCRIPHSIDTKVFNTTKKIKNKKLRILYIGRLVEEKGIRDLLNVFPKLDFKKVEFIIVGKGPLANYVKSKQKELPLIYLGHISDIKKIANVYAKSDIFVLNSYKTDKWEEFFGIVLLEAMASGLAIVSTDCIGPKELITDGKNGFLIKQKDKGELYKSLKKLIDNPELRKKFVKNGKNVVKNYSIEKVSLELYEVLKCQK